MVNRYTKVVLTTIAICLVVLTVRIIFNFPEGQASPGIDLMTRVANKNGHNWDLMPLEAKVGFVAGYMTCSAYLTEVVDTIKTEEFEEIKKLFLNPFSLILCDVSIGQLVDGLDSFYKDYRNKQIPICEAIYIVRFSALGASDEKVDKFVQLLRTPPESRREDWTVNWVKAVVEEGGVLFMPRPLYITDADKKEGKD